MKSPVQNNVLLVSLCLAVLLVSAPSRLQSETKELKTGGFQVQQELLLPASPEDVYDAATGDISGWWDHSFSAHPKKLYIEAKPGGERVDARMRRRALDSHAGPNSNSKDTKIQRIRI